MKDTTGGGGGGGGSGADGPSIVIVTGASRGYGLQLAVEACDLVEGGSSVVLVGRSETALKVARDKVEQQNKKKVDVKYVVADLSLLTQVPQAVERILEGEDLNRFTNLFLFNNVATLGDVTKTFDAMVDPEEILNYFNLNVCACMLLTSQILMKSKDAPIKSLYIINVNSFMAMEPKAGCSLYCTGKAARDMMFKVLAAERPELRILNWSPGSPSKMVGGGMAVVDASLNKIIDDKKAVQCSDSARKLMRLLVEDKFASGSHAHYYDAAADDDDVVA